MQTDDILKVVSIMLGVVSSLIIFIGGLIVWIFNRHLKNCDESKACNRDDHTRIHERIDDMFDRRGK